MFGATSLRDLFFLLFDVAPCAVETVLVCGNVGGYLNAHHIKKFSEYPELRFELSNGMTMCRDCHYIPGIHKKG